MSSPLPDYADPWLLCDQSRSFDGRVELTRMTRLAPLLATTDGEAAFVLAFSRDKKRRAIVQGRVSSSLSLPCQRCLEPVVVEVDSEFALALVGGSQEADLTPEELNPIVVEGNELILLDLLEDELMLALPVAPMHDIAECGVNLEQINQLPEGFETESPVVEVDKENPFAALASLKGDETKQ